MSENRAGYDVVECLYIEEGTPGTTPVTGAWRPMWNVTNFDLNPKRMYKPKVGLGRQLPSSFTLMKKYAEATIDLEMLAKQASAPAFEWTELWYYLITNAAYGATFSLDKRLKSLSVGAKLDLATDEFWWLKGCKIQQIDIRGEVDAPLTQRINLMGLEGTFGTTDYVSGSATRNANPTSEYIKHEDCEINVGTNILERLNNWTFSIKRTLERKGRDATTTTKYRAIVERAVDVSLSLNLDFNSTTELMQFINSTEFTAIITIPTGSGGRIITLSNGKWLEHTSPHKELDLIAVDLSAKFSGVAVTTTA